MPAQKIRDVAVKTGTYQDNQGNTKGRWHNVGALMKGEDGGEFLILQRWFNPAGVTNPENRESVVLSCFPLREQQSSAPQQSAPQPAQSAPASEGNPDDDIPFTHAWAYLAAGIIASAVYGMAHVPGVV